VRGIARRGERAARLLFLAEALAGLVAARAHAQLPSPTPAREARQVDVAARGASVMPFDLERTRHEFRAVADGGVQTVSARDPADGEQVALVRAHLKAAAARFAHGDFSDPAFIHGSQMPGLAELEAGASRLRIRYEPLADGARIRYSTADPSLVRAIHRWFAAQTSDHGSHAHP
jgi:hypothetical protein